jgi:hypothetical protein
MRGRVYVRAANERFANRQRRELDASPREELSQPRRRARDALRRRRFRDRHPRRDFLQRLVL